MCQMTSQDHLLEGSCTFMGGDHRHLDSEDIIFSIFHVNSCDCMFKGLCKFMGESLSRLVTTLPFLVAIGSTSGDKKYLICHVTLQNHITEGSCNFVNGSCSF